jgi:hypothetical protein
MPDDFKFKPNTRAIKNLTKSGDMRGGLQILGGIAEGKAKERVRVDTGNLRRSITHEVSLDLRGWYMRFGTNVYYGIYQELGTRFHPPFPYLRPALEYLRKVLSGRT